MPSGNGHSCTLPVHSLRNKPSRPSPSRSSRSTALRSAERMLSSLGLFWTGRRRGTRRPGEHRPAPSVKGLALPPLPIINGGPMPFGPAPCGSADASGSVSLDSESIICTRLSFAAASMAQYSGGELQSLPLSSRGRLAIRLAVRAGRSDEDAACCAVSGRPSSAVGCQSSRVS